MSDNPYQAPGPQPTFSYQAPGRGNTIVVRRIGMLSLAKMLAVLYASLGLIIGAFFFAFALIGAVVGPGNQLAAGLVAGAAIIVLAPLFYGLIGFVGGIVLAAAYNFIASFAGGVQMEFEPAPSDQAL
jgi:hypothetical protein